MRLAVSKTLGYRADLYCVDARSAKKVLKEKAVSILAIDYYLVGRDNGCDVLKWANTHHVLPNYVVVMERDRAKRLELINKLKVGGYRSGDNITFIKV